jgi:uncharacterized protein involved in type VI secretion and phage assembly
MAKLDTAVQCRIKVEQEELRHTVSSVKLEQFIDRHHVLRIVIKQGGRAAESEQFLDHSSFTGFLGKSISVRIEPQGGVVDSGRALEFVGVVTQVSLDNAVDGLNQATITAHAPSIVLDGARRNSLNHDRKASDIVKDILQQYPITLGSVDTTEKSLTYSVQYRETDYEYLMRLATSSGLFAFYDGQKFHAVKANSSTSEELNWRQTLGLFSIGLGTASPNQTSQAWDPVNKQVMSSDFTGAPSGSSPSDLARTSLDASESLYSKLGFSIANKSTDMAGLDAVLTRAKEAAVGRMVTCIGESIVPALAVGSCARVSGMSNFDGDYFVTKVTHTIEESGQYHNRFESIPLDTAYPTPLHGLDPITDLQSAIVTDNNDPEKLGRVKVKFSWMESEESPWLRISVAHAGNERGWYSIPEIDDEVLVGFENGDPDQPVVIGALWNGKDMPPPDAPEAENNIKLFTTKSGNLIKFTDTGGSEEILVTQKDGKNKIVLGLSGPSITLESEGDISIKGKTITLESTSGDVSFKSGGKLTHESTGDLQIKAGMNLKAEGSMNLELKGGTMAKLEGGAMTEIKGAIVKIN